MFEILFVFGRSMVWSVARGLRFLGFASSRATKIYGDLVEIYGDLAKIYGASPQFFAAVSCLSFAYAINMSNECRLDCMTHDA